MVLRGYRLQGTDLTGITQEIMQLLDSLDKNSGVSKGDVWIFPPQADDLALTGNDF